MEIINEIFVLVLIPLMGILTKYFVAWIGAKAEELKSKTTSNTIQKYEDMIKDTIIQCVVATNQTYVDNLKRQGKFDEEAQKEAFNRTLQAVELMLSEEAQNYIIEISGDLEAYLTQLIESAVYTQKEKSPLF